jgi:hypothetical protein
MIKMIKSRRMIWAGHVAHERRRMHTGFWWENQKERDQKENLDVCGRIILKYILEKYNGVI